MKERIALNPMQQSYLRGREAKYGRFSKACFVYEYDPTKVEHARLVEALQRLPRSGKGPGRIQPRACAGGYAVVAGAAGNPPAGCGRERRTGGGDRPGRGSGAHRLRQGRRTRGG